MPIFVVNNSLFYMTSDIFWIHSITYLIMWALIFFRYVVVAGMFYLLFFKLKGHQFKAKRISTKLRKPNQTQKEIWNSFISSGIFAFGGTSLIYMWENGHTKIYVDITQFGVWYLFMSTAIFLFIHETYYYWLHRWMHHPKIYRLVHRMHHDSIATSPWTSFSFDIPETFLQAIFVPVMVFLMPMHFGCLLYTSPSPRDRG